MPETTRLHSRASMLIIALFTLLGAAQSFWIVFHLWGADSDVADPVLIWKALHSHGWHALTAWRYTQDNWLLSLMPLDFALFSIFGDRPVVLVTTGLMFFYLVVLLTGVLVGRLGGVRAGGFTVMVLLFAGQPTLGNEGFLGYAVSHGISLAWGLLGLLLSTLWLDRRRIGLLVGAGVCLFVGCMSDPWDDAAFLVPIAVAAAALAWRAPRGARRGMAAIAIMSAIVGVLVQTKGLGILGFLPGPIHRVATLAQMRQNLTFAARYVVVFFNVLPGSFAPASGNPSTPTIWADGCLFAGLVGWCAVALARHSAGLTPRRQLVALTALGSIGLMMVALVVTGFQAGMATARYLSNIFVALPLLLAASPIGIGRFATVQRLAVIALGGLFVLSGVISGAPIWTLREPQMRSNGIPQLADFLAKQGVTFAYGPYWETEANAMAWVTRGRVTIRPVAFDAATGRFVPKGVQTLARWYRPAAVRSAPREMAFILSDAPDGCGKAQSCAAMAMAQFGKPSETLAYSSLTVLIYHHRLYLDP